MWFCTLNLNSYVVCNDLHTIRSGHWKQASKLTTLLSALSMLWGDYIITIIITTTTIIITTTTTIIIIIIITIIIIMI